MSLFSAIRSRPAQQVLSLRRQLDAAVAADEQPMTYKRLQSPYLQGNSRLSSADTLSRSGKAPTLGDQHKAAQEVNIERRV